LPGQVGQMAARGVARQDLQDEEMDGGDRIQHARAPGVADLATHDENGGRVEQVGQLCLNVSERVTDHANHPGPPGCELFCRMSCFALTIVEEVLYDTMSLSLNGVLAWDYLNAIRVRP
jgi:hypothetical protein